LLLDHVGQGQWSLMVTKNRNSVSAAYPQKELCDKLHIYYEAYPQGKKQPY